MRILITFLVCLISVVSNAENDRCLGKELKAERCNALRNLAMSQGCINQAKYEELVQQNLCPFCYDGEHYASCPLGCFGRGTRILVNFSPDQKPIWEAVENIVQNPSAYTVWAMAHNAGMKNPVLQPFKIRAVTHGPEELPLIEVVTQLGSKIRFSTEHAVLLYTGVMVAAERLQVGDVLLQMFGNADQIIEINHVPIDDEVFNILVDADPIVSHTLVAENLIVGDQYWQGVLTPMLNKTIIHD